MSKTRLPPLNALRAFEAAAEYRSFTNGAYKLGLTQTAISHHVKKLEHFLQVPLFERNGRGVALTSHGEILFDATRRAFQEIDTAVTQISPTTTSRTLVVSLMPHFSARWAIFHLGEFQKRFPSYNVRLHHSRDPINFDRDGIDIGVRWGADPRPGVISTELFGLSLAPVASATFAARMENNPSPTEIYSHKLLQVRGRFTWESWLKSAGSESYNRASSFELDDYNVLISALLDNQGIGLCPLLWVSDLLKQGDLRQLSALTIDSENKYCVIYQAKREYQAKIQAFREWIIEKSRALFTPCFSPRT